MNWYELVNEPMNDRWLNVERRMSNNTSWGPKRYRLVKIRHFTRVISTICLVARLVTSVSSPLGPHQQSPWRLGIAPGAGLDSPTVRKHDGGGLVKGEKDANRFASRWTTKGDSRERPRLKDDGFVRDEFWFKSSPYHWRNKPRDWIASLIMDLLDMTRAPMFIVLCVSGS